MLVDRVFPGDNLSLLHRVAHSAVGDDRVAWRECWLIGCFPRLGGGTSARLAMYSRSCMDCSFQREWMYYLL